MDNEEKGRNTMKKLLLAAICSSFLTTAHADLWTPADTNTLVWYDASDASTILTNGTSVTDWLDKSGNLLHLSQINGASQPTLNGSTVKLSGSQWMYTSATNLSRFYGADANKVAVFFVAKYYSGAVILQAASSGNRVGFEGSGRFDFPNDTTGLLTSWSSTLNNTEFKICAGVADGTTQAVYLNGSNVASQANALSMSDVTKPLWLGSRDGGGGSYGTFDIQEIVFLNSAAPEVREKMEGYLAWKWGLVDGLPSDHPYKQKAPMGPPSGTVIIIR